MDADFFFFAAALTICILPLRGTTTAVHGNWAKIIFIASRNFPLLSKTEKEKKKHCVSALLKAKPTEGGRVEYLRLSACVAMVTGLRTKQRR